MLQLLKSISIHGPFAVTIVVLVVIINSPVFITIIIVTTADQLFINKCSAKTVDTDVNMVGFSVVAGQVVDFDIDTALNGPGGLSSYLRLFDGQGQQLAFSGAAAASDESVVGFDAYLRYNFATAGTYYIGVSNSNNIGYDSITGNGDTSGAVRYV